MKVSDISGLESITVLTASEDVLSEEIEDIAVSELMSDILTMDHDNMLLISALCTDQAIRTADIMGAVAVIITKGKQVTDTMISIAEECDIALFATEQRNFAVCSNIIKKFNCPQKSEN